MRSAAAVLALAALVGLSAGADADGLMVKLVSITRPVHPGGAVILVVQTQPGATCTGNRQGHYGNDYSIKLPTKTIGTDGRARWQWSVLPGNRPIGERSVHVTCTAGGQTGTIETQFDVE
jgi:hypothetical protein